MLPKISFYLLKKESNNKINLINLIVVLLILFIICYFLRKYLNFDKITNKLKDNLKNREETTTKEILRCTIENKKKIENNDKQIKYPYIEYVPWRFERRFDNLRY